MYKGSRNGRPGRRLGCRVVAGRSRDAASAVINDGGVGRQPSRINYLSPGLFDHGGIARYGRYQLRALREVSRAPVFAASLLPETEPFPDALHVEHVGHGTGAVSKVRYSGRATAWARPRAMYWCGHIHLAPLTLGLSRVVGGRAVVNVYGLEVWSCERPRALAALRSCEIVADCHATAEYVIDQGLAERERVHVVWDPVDPRFAPHANDEDAAVRERYGLGPSPFRVMFLGRLAPAAAHKSPDALIRAFARARLPAGSQLVVAGAGARQDELRAMASDAGLGARAVFTGRVADEDLPALYRSASLFVLVSRRGKDAGEGLPLTPIEAAACGAPIVVGNEDGSREAVIDGETGFLVRSRDEAELAAVLERASTMGDALARMGRAAATDAATRFSFARFRAEHRALLEQWGAA